MYFQLNSLTVSPHRFLPNYTIEIEDSRTSTETSGFSIETVQCLLSVSMD